MAHRGGDQGIVDRATGQARRRRLLKQPQVAIRRQGEERVAKALAKELGDQFAGGSMGSRKPRDHREGLDGYVRRQAWIATQALQGRTVPFVP